MASNPLDGTWFNQLGSEVQFVTTADGLLTGKYSSAASDPKGFYPLSGRFDFGFPPTVGVTLGWAVWREKPLKPIPPDTEPRATTETWSGQYFRATNDGLEERIVTQWLLTESTTVAELWGMTLIGQDTFTRKKPTAAAIAIARALTVGSPHA